MAGKPQQCRLSDKEFATCWALLVSGFGMDDAKIGDDKRWAYHEALKQLDGAILLYTIKALIAKIPDNYGRLPLPGRILREYAEQADPNPTAVEAWDKAWSAIRQWGHNIDYRSALKAGMPALHPKIAATLQGGFWTCISDCPAKDLHYRRQEFLERYKSITETAIQRQLAPPSKPVQGMIENVQKALGERTTEAIRNGKK